MTFRQAISILLLTAIILCTAGCAGSANTPQVPSETDMISASDAVSPADSPSNIGSDADMTPTEPLLSADKFIHTDGTLLIDEKGEQYLIRGVNFCNDALLNPPVKPWEPLEERYADLEACGINTVRFLINYGLFENDNDPYNYKESGFEWLDKNIALAKKHGIKLIFNMHLPQEGWPTAGRAMPIYSSKGKDAQDRLTALWTAIAQRYFNEPTVLGYSLANEPVVLIESDVQDAYDRYGAFMQRIVDSIRTVDTNHVIIVEAALGFSYGDGNWSESINAGFPVITDDNLMYEFHNYDPVKFTCQGEGEGIVYTKKMRKELENNLLNSAGYAWEQNVPVLCGEIGAVWSTYEYEESAEDWMCDCIDIFTENNINFCFFAFWDEYAEPTGLQYSFWNDKVLDILKNKLGDPNAETSGVFGYKDTFNVPLEGFAFADYMKASGVNCILTPWYRCESEEFYFFSEPITGWSGNDSWHIEVDLGSIDVPDDKPLGSLNFDVISYGRNRDALKVKFSLTAYLRDPEGDNPDIILEGYPKEYDLTLFRDEEFNQNIANVSLHNFDVAETIGELRNYWVVIDVQMLEYSDYFDIGRN